MKGNIPIAAVNYLEFPNGNPVVIHGRRHTWNGKPSSPGMPPGVLEGYGDPKWGSKLDVILEDMPRPVFYLTCHHTGEINSLLDGQYPEIGNSIMAVHGDAIITPEETKRNKTVVSGGADCMFAAIYDGRKYAVVHFSVLNEFGWKNKNFQEPLSVRLFRELDPTSSTIIIGPTIGPCCYDWSVDHKQKLVYQMLQTDSDISPEILFQERMSNREKIGFNFRDTIINRLLKLGVKNIDISKTVCTCCNNTLYHSRRHEGNGDKRRLRNIIALPIQGR